MWWSQPRLRNFEPLLPNNILEIVARAYTVVEVGGVSGYGPERGRNFEQLFYALCKRQGVPLSERAGARSIAGRRSASGFNHEVDAATKALNCITHWELKYLTAKLDKNELLIFNGKGLDFLYGSNPLFAKIPRLRFLLSGSNVKDESRYFAVQWGIMIIEPGRLPLPLLYEAAAHGASTCLREADTEALRYQIPWACRPLQNVIHELAEWCSDLGSKTRHSATVTRRAKEVIDIQEQIGKDVMDYLDEQFSDWIDELVNDTWEKVGGW